MRTPPWQAASYAGHTQTPEPVCRSNGPVRIEHRTGGCLRLPAFLVLEPLNPKFEPLRHSWRSGSTRGQRVPSESYRNDRWYMFRGERQRLGGLSEQGSTLWRFLWGEK